MILLPICYLALVGTAAYGVYWHVTEHFAWFKSPFGGPRFIFVKVLVYSAILAVGIIIVFFLLKPLFARRPRHAQPLALHPGAEPRLYAIIHGICRAVGSPKPSRIDLDCHLNASAGFRRGYLSFVGGDLVLTLGLPLVANLTVQELAGVLAHEFGHFTQGVAMRLGYVISRINLWFARVVDERDAWDETLSQLSENPDDWRIALVVWTAQIGVGMSRLVLRMLMTLGMALSGFLSRQMEYHADACGIRLAGSENFERTTLKLATLSAALKQTYQGVSQGWKQKGCLPDNLPELLRRVHNDLPDTTIQQIHDTLGLSTTRWMDTHPCPAERIRRARTAAKAGILSDDRPASALFECFDVPARQVTELHYTDDLGLDVTPESILPLAPLHPDDDSALPSPAPRPHRTLAAAPIQESLLLGAPELLLPLPLQPIRFATAVENPNSPSADPSELAGLVDQLSTIRPRIAELADQARRASTAIGPGDKPTGPDEFVSDPAQELQSLRHAAREVIHATSKRLHIGLLLAASSLETAEADHLQRLHDWLHEAESEYDAWFSLAREAPLLSTEFSRSILTGEPEGTLLSRIEDLRQDRSRLKVLPLLVPDDTGQPRKLRIGPHAGILRDIDHLGREANAWQASYRAALTDLWSVAGREELRHAGSG
jgi:Zn-dependent protease with chaperone function